MVRKIEASFCYSYRWILPVFLQLFCSLFSLTLHGNPSELWSLQPLNLGVKHFSEQKTLNLGVKDLAHSIDRFIQEKLDIQNLQISPPADRGRLLRRVSLDLTGLPPDPEELQAALNSEADWERVYESWVDQALASPRYGERWAQHWLDVIRWAETVGFETNLPRPNAWHYRDWVIEALNADMPYAEFVYHQVAGDLTEKDAALGFLVAGPANLPGQIGRDEESMRQARQDELDETIRTVSQGILGLTVGCARCHDHKFDPISQKDYYAMQAVFAGLQYGDRRLRGPENDEWVQKAVPLEEELREKEQLYEQTWRQHGLRPPLSGVEEALFDPIKAEKVRMWIDASESNASASLYEFEVWAPDSTEDSSRNVALASLGATATASSFALENQTRHPDNLNDGRYDDRQDFPWRAGQGGAAWIEIELAEAEEIDRIFWRAGYSVPVNYRIEVLNSCGDWIEVAHTRDRAPRISDRRSAEQVQIAGLSRDEVQSLLKLTGSIQHLRNEVGRLKSGPQTYAASFNDDPPTTWLLKRGDPMQRADALAPAVPVVLGDLGLEINAAENQRRKAFVETITEHPLFWRVIANRVWQHHFGRGLVNTPSDFGNQGTAPTHPELLDWLALFLQKNNGSLKALHKEILMTRTYRQSSRPNERGLEVDAESKWLWRFPPRRLEAEAIRDSILRVSGKLNLKMGGPGFDFFNQRGGLSDYHPKETFDENGWRRMIYAHKIRMQAIDIFGALDCPDFGQMQPKRTRSITPIQALGLLNSPFVLRQAEFATERIRQELSQTDTECAIRRATQLIWLRDPDPSEMKQLTQLARNHGLEQVFRVLFNSSAFLYLD